MNIDIFDINSKYDIDGIISEYLNGSKTKQGEKKMKQCDVCLPDGNGKIRIGRGSVFITPSTSGFMLWSNPEGEVEIHCFASFAEVLKYLTDNKLLDLSDTIIAENI